MSVILSKTTVEILKNFASINETLYFPKGNVLTTRSVKKHTLAEVEIEEKFPRKFNIYDMNQFLAVVGQFDRPSLDFDKADEYVVISDESGGLAVKYHYGDESLAYIPDPKKKLELPSVDVNFEFTEVQFKSIVNMARTLGTPELALESDGESLNLVTIDSKNSSTNTTSLLLGEAPSDVSFSLVWKIEYLKIINGTYDVAVSKQGISRFKHSEMPLTYHIMLEANASRYDE